MFGHLDLALDAIEYRRHKKKKIGKNGPYIRIVSHALDQGEYT